MKANKTQTPATVTDKTPASACIITPDNVQTLGERIALRALKTCYEKSGMPYIYQLYTSLCADIAENRKDPRATLSDGYDIADTATAFLCAYIGRDIHAPADNGETDKNGNPADVLRVCFRAVNRYIMGERQHEYKRIYLDDYNGAEVVCPFEWDIDTVEDYTAVKRIISEMKLSAGEMQFLTLRMRGKSLETIAHAMSVKRDTLNAWRARIKNKAGKCESLRALIDKL